jgi:SAM-dependent methyltransferase
MFPKLVKKENFKSSSGRFQFLKAHYKSGNVLDLGNIGGLYGGGKSNSFHHKIKELPGVTLYGFDLFKPEDETLYVNQSYGDIEVGLPYQDKYFDTVYMGALIEHLSNFKSVLGNIHRILKDDGVFILDTGNAYDLRKVLKYLFTRTEDMGDPTHLNYFTPASFCSTLQNSHFIVDILGEKNPYKIKGMGTTLLAKCVKDTIHE